MTDKLITQIEDFIVKQQSQPALEYVDTAGQDKASAAASAPKGKDLDITIKTKEQKSE